MSLLLRLLIISTPFVIWAVLYLAVRSGVIPPPLLLFPLRAGCFLCAAAWAGGMVFDLTHLADGAMVVFWGFFGAETWIEHKLKKSGVVPSNLP